MNEVYESLLDVPLDEPGEDGDDQLVPSGEVEHEAPLSSTARFSGAPRIVAPYPGVLKIGDRGNAVRALNRALSKAGFRRWGIFSLVFTRWVKRALRRFQTANDLPATGVYDLATHRALARYFDAYAIKYLLVAQIPKPTQDDLDRAGFLAELMYVYNRRWQIAYSQARAYDRSKPPRALDCSASAEWAAEHAGLRSLSGYSSFGYGNTDSQIARFRRLGWMRQSISEAKIGDPIYYGQGGDPGHVGYYIGVSGGRARIWSFGSFPAKILGADYRRDRIAICNLTGR